MLPSLAAQTQSHTGFDPKLIQKLIERLLKEAAAEATQKGWCDTELGKRGPPGSSRKRRSWA